LKVVETERLVIRWLTTDDAPFILELVNDPDWLKYIGDKGVRTLDDARNYLVNGPIDMVRRLGFGSFLVEMKETGESMGTCGLIKRDGLADVDIGFAFLPAYRTKGYAFEAASAVLSYGRDAFGMKRVVAIATPDNASSARLLEKLGFRLERMVRLPNDSVELRLFSIDLV
jgi:RimJ/RimL family protein N-acetyltransferase